jgi:hypothetical protein
MLSCPEREAMRACTLRNLAETDWDEPCEVVIDSTTFERRQKRNEETARVVLVKAVASDADYILFFEDDLLFNKRIAFNLRHWTPLQQGKFTLASLYNPNIQQIHAGRHYFIAKPEAVYGSQAVLIARECAKYIIDHYEEVPGMGDIKFSRLAARIGAIYYHVPSLVEHVGFVSVLGETYHRAVDFDAEFVTDALFVAQNADH